VSSSSRTPTARAGAVLVGAGLLAGCDVPDYGFSDAGVPLRGDPGVGTLQIIDVSVADKILSEDESIELSFDRYLKPSTTIRQSFAVRDAFNQPVPAPLVQYDPVTRIVRVENPEPRPSDWLKPDLPYILLLGVPELGRDLGGFRAIDDAPLDKAQRFGFQTRGERKAEPRSRVSFCASVLPVLKDKCASCHNAGDPLDLSASEGVGRALGKTARTSTRGPGNPTAPGKHFGDDMPLIEPGNPANSYLLYKTLLAPNGTRQSPRCADQPLPQPRVKFSADVSSAHRETLHAFIGGAAMPPDTAQALTFEERRALSTWIQNGAETPACPSTCP
jgi:hypothetical protein